MAKFQGQNLNLVVSGFKVSCSFHCIRRLPVRRMLFSPLTLSVGILIQLPGVEPST